MSNYRIEWQQNDGSWSVQDLQSIDDTGAITYGLRVRSTNRCELYQAERWLATFDGVEVANDALGSHSTEGTDGGHVGIETEVAYFHCWALRERERSRKGASAASNLAHLTTAEHLESLARVLEAVQRRLTFYEVNASCGRGRTHVSL